MLWGRWKTGIAWEDMLQEMLELLGVPFSTVKTPVNYTQKGAPYPHMGCEFMNAVVR